MSPSVNFSSQRFDAAVSFRNSGISDPMERLLPFSDVLESKKEKCPYGGMAKDGVIEYNNVTFICDYKSNSICLGDMSKPKEVLCVSLPSGGHLKVNVKNFEELSGAAGMFNPEDLAAIMRAIAKYKHYSGKAKEAKEEELEIVEENAKHASEGSRDLVEESHKKYALGTKEKKDWRDMSGEEWDKMLGGVDAYIDAFKEKLRDMKKMQEEAVQEAGLEAEPGFKTIAASAAALAVANGFDSATKVSVDVATELKVEEKLEK